MIDEFHKRRDLVCVLGEIKGFNLNVPREHFTYSRTSLAFWKKRLTESYQYASDFARIPFRKSKNVATVPVEPLECQLYTYYPCRLREKELRELFPELKAVFID